MEVLIACVLVCMTYIEKRVNEEDIHFNFY